MARVVVREGEKVRFTGELRHRDGRVRFGRSMGVDIRIVDSQIGRIHAHLELRGRRLFVVDQASTNGTFVNESPTFLPTPIKASDEVRMGPAKFSIEVTLDEDELQSAHAKEEEFIAKVVADPKDLDLRAVYADWLEENGEPQRAELLRLHNERDAIEDASLKKHDDPAFKRLELQMEALSSSQDDAWWRTLIARAPVENCMPPTPTIDKSFPELSFKCPKRWSDLTVTAEDNVRFCDECKRNVHYCSTLANVRFHGTRNDCVAFDSSLRRKRALAVFQEGELHSHVVEMGEVG